MYTESAEKPGLLALCSLEENYIFQEAEKNNWGPIIHVNLDESPPNEVWLRYWYLTDESCEGKVKPMWLHRKTKVISVQKYQNMMKGTSL